MRRLIRNKVVLVVLSAWLLYWPIAYFIPKDLLIEFINGAIAAMSIGIVSAYLPGSWYILRNKPYKLTGGDLLLLGATLVQISLAGLFTWGWVFRILDQPVYLSDHPFRGWMIYGLFIGSTLHLMAWEVEEDKGLPTKGWMHVGALVAIGIGVVALLLMIANL